MNIEKNQWIQERCWKEIIKKMPIPCVDVIAHRDHEFLMGWRSIPPYKNVWALLGGRILRGESFEAAAGRHCMKSGIRISKVRHVGVYPVVFHSRHDIAVCLAARVTSGTPQPTAEMARYKWFKKNKHVSISPIGDNYNKMLEHWLSVAHHTP